MTSSPSPKTRPLGLRQISRPESRWEPVLIVARIAAIIFAVEGLLMLAFAALPSGVQTFGPHSEWGMALLDAAALVLISSPFVYLWVIRPFALAHTRSESDLRRSESRLNEAQHLAHLGSW